MGKRQKGVLDFAARVLLERDGNFEGSWHSFAPDVRRVIESVERLGYVETNEFQQFRITRDGLERYSRGGLGPVRLAHA